LACIYFNNIASMTFFSELLQYRMIDPKERTARLSDLALDIKADPYPPITHLVYQKELREQVCLPWTSVTGVDPLKRQIHVKDLREGEPVHQDRLVKTTFLKKNVLDGLMLDLSRRSSILANDLWLEQESSELLLCGIDTSFWAILRRLSGGLIARNSHSGVKDWKYIEFLRGEAEAARSGRVYRGLIDRLPPGEVAYLADQLPYPYAAELLTLLSDLKAADTLEAITPELQLEVFEELDPEHADDILTLMRPDISADLLGQMEPGEAQSWLEQMPKEQSDRVLKLMAYPEDSAGGVMTDDLVAFPKDISVREAISRLRQELHSQDPASFVQILYAINNEQEYCIVGAFSLRDLLIAGDDRHLDQVMNPYLLTLHPSQKAKDAARRVVESELAALPVVDEDGKLLGAITIDTALALMTPRKSKTEVLRLFS
jgi:CBS domain-containing protein